jgi:hypothetical protein
MPIRTLANDTPLSSVRAELTYTQARLRAHTHGVPFRAVFDALRNKWTVVHAKELELRDAIILAQALIDQADNDLDAFAKRAVRIILDLTGNDQGHTLYKHFLGDKTASDFVRPTLGKQLEAMAGWIDSFSAKTAPEALKNLVTELTELVANARTAAKAMTDAEKARDTFRDIGERSQFIVEVDTSRKDTHEALSKLPRDNAGLAKNFADRFFRREAKPEKADSEEAAPTIQSVKDTIAALKAQLEEQNTLLEQLMAEEKKARDAEIAEEEKALLAMEKQLAEQKAQADALRAQIEAKKKE